MNLPSLALACGALTLTLTGCVSVSDDLGRPPPVVLETPRLPVSLPQASSGAAVRTVIHDALAQIGDGDVQSVRVAIFARSASDAEKLRRILVGMGADPARLTVEPGHWPRNRLAFTRALAETVPCATAINPVAPDDPLPSLMSLAHCTQTNNLANMLVDPEDLVGTPRHAAQDGDYVVGTVQSWRSNRNTPLPSQDTAAGTGSGSGGGGGAPGTSVLPAAGPAANGTTGAPTASASGGTTVAPPLTQ